MAAIDAVYTWVDGAWPGYAERLQRLASDRHDLNPNRYRDNLDILRYNLRSLARYAPWFDRIFLVTARPQVPAWLDTATVTVVHHDEFMPSGDLPTFNSFAIVANLHRIPGLAPRFVYIEDDRLFGAPTDASDFFDDLGRPRVLLEWRGSRRPSDRAVDRLSPWNRALAYSNQLLDERYGARRRRMVGHTPLPVEIRSWRAMIDAWPEPFRRTSGSRFRATGNVAPEHLYPHYLLEETQGVAAPAWRQAVYHPLNNVVLFQRGGLARIEWRRPKFFCLNDDFGQRPNPRAVSVIRRALDRWFPEASRFERAIDPRNAAT